MDRERFVINMDSPLGWKIMGIGDFRENSCNMAVNLMRLVVNFGALVIWGLLKTVVLPLVGIFTVKSVFGLNRVQVEDLILPIIRVI